MYVYIYIYIYTPRILFSCYVVIKFITVVPHLASFCHVTYLPLRFFLTLVPVDSDYSKVHDKKIDVLPEHCTIVPKHVVRVSERICAATVMFH
jgi:hypothetical protein